MNGYANTKTQAMRRYVVDIVLTAEQIEAFYAGHVRFVSARDRNGLRLQFPLSSLRSYVGHHGVNGRFQLTVDERNRLCGFEQV